MLSIVAFLLASVLVSVAGTCLLRFDVVPEETSMTCTGSAQGTTHTTTAVT